MFTGLKIECQACDEPYANEIRRWFLSTFPGAGPISNDDRLEAVFQAIMGTGKVRLGPKPTPESQVAIRQVIRAYMDEGQPIPVLVAWGSEKPNGAAGIDIAEIAGLKTLLDLNQRVETQGARLEIRMRIEDSSAPFLFYTRKEEAAAQAARYTKQLVALIKILGDSTRQPVITPVPESTFMSWREFEVEVEPFIDKFVRYIEETDIYGTASFETRDSYKHLAGFGWQGHIPMEQREYYRGIYRKLDNASHEQATQTLARYLATALLRFKLGLTGAADYWKEKGYLQLSFNPPIPGAPKGRVARVFYYRTLPENVSTQHIAPWRAKGYLEVTSQDRMRPRLASFSDTTKNYHRASVVLASGEERVTVDCDYVVKD